jgi:tRNA G18 (ribose-2'-O)-methylase SpoU
MDDPRADVFRNVRDADLRGRDDLFMAESELVLRRLLKTPQRLHSILLSVEKFAKLGKELDVLPGSVRVFVAELPLIHEIAAFHVHRGVLAAGFRLRPEELSLDAALGHLQHQSRCTIVLAEGWTNVDNMGSLFRNAAAFGVDGIMLDPTCCDPLYRKAIRVSMGHALSIPYAVSHSWIDDLQVLKQWGFAVIGAECHPRSVPVWEINHTEKTAIVFGNEGSGLSERTLQRCDQVAEIPMAAEVPSINVATAVAVFLYELNRGAR